MIRVERATVEHARAMGAQLQLFGCTPLRAEDRAALAVKHVEQSIEAWTWLDDGVPVAMAGAMPYSILAGIVGLWLLATPAAYRNPRAFWRASKATVAHFAREYATPYGRVDVEFEASIRWLKRLGFTVRDDLAVDADGRRFFPFVMER